MLKKCVSRLRLKVAVHVIDQRDSGTSVCRSSVNMCSFVNAVQIHVGSDDTTV